MPAPAEGRPRTLGPPLGQGLEIGIGLVIAIFFIIQLFPLDDAKNLSHNEKRYSKPEEMARHSSGRCLICLLWMPLARALLPFLSGKKDCTVYLAGHFGRRVFLAGSHHPGTRSDS